MFNLSGFQLFCTIKTFSVLLYIFLSPSFSACVRAYVWVYVSVFLSAWSDVLSRANLISHFTHWTFFLNLYLNLYSYLTRIKNRLSNLTNILCVKYCKLRHSRLHGMIPGSLHIHFPFWRVKVPVKLYLCGTRQIICQGKWRSGSACHIFAIKALSSTVGTVRGRWVAYLQAHKLLVLTFNKINKNNMNMQYPESLCTAIRYRTYFISG